MAREKESSDDKDKDDKEKKEEKQGLMTKAVAAVFASVIAPVLLAVGMKFSDKVSDVIVAPLQPKVDAAKSEPAKADSSKTEPAKSETAKAEPAKSGPGSDSDSAKIAASQPADTGKSATAGAGSTAGGTGPSAAPSDRGGGKGKNKKAKAAAPQTVGPVVRLFNLKDLTGWYKYVDKTSKSDSPPGKNKDPDGVYSVGKGMIDISGQYWGALSTEEEYANYHLTVEFKWGTKTWGPKGKAARASGVLLHCTGPDGAHKGWAPQSIKCQIIEGGTGDLVCYETDKSKVPVSLQVESVYVESSEGKGRKNVLAYKPGAPLSTITHGFVSRLGNGPDWKNVLGYHRAGDVEKPSGEWNTLECICQKDRITVILNGTVVNQAVNVKPSRGRIGLHSHGAEIFFRRVELQRLQ